MVPLYLKSGKIAKASDLITKLLEEDPDDLELLTISADVYLVRGLPDKAIASLESVLKHNPEDKNALDKLALIYEWNVMPREAMHTWAKIAKIRKKRFKPLEQLVMYYRYFDMLPEEVATIIKLNKLQSGRFFVNFFLKELNTEVARLADEHKQNPEDPYLNYLIKRIFIVGEEFKSALTGDAKVNVSDYITYVIEYFVAVDRVSEGLIYAERMDKRDGRGIKYQLQLAIVLGWFKQYDAALELAGRLYKIAPDNVDLLRETAVLARSAQRFDVAETYLERLVNLEPDEPVYQEDLGLVYLETGKHKKAVGIFRQLAEKFDNWLKYAHNMLRAALYSSDKQLMAEVISDTANVDISDSDYLRTKSDVLLGLGRPLEAYPILKDLAERPEATIYDFERLIDAAVASTDNKLVAETIELALKFSPGDVVLMRKAGEAWRNAGQPLKAYDFYRKVVGKEGLEADIIEMLQAASETQNLKLAGNAAKYAESVAPENVKVIAQAGEIMLWLNSPGQGYPYYKKAAELTGGDREYVMTLVQVASFTGDKDIFRDAAETAIKLRPYDEEVAMLAAAVWAAAGDSVKAQKLIAEFAGKGGKNHEMLLKWAEFADSYGLSEEAYRIYDQLYGLGYKKKKVRKELARLAGWTERPEVAARLFGEMSNDKPQSFSLAMQAAKSYSDAADYKKAVSFYERASSLKPADIDLKLELAKNYGFAGMNIKRIHLFTKLYNAGQLPEAQRIELARAFLDEHKPVPALDILEPYARLHKLPRFEGFLLASALQQAGRGADTSAVYKRLGKEYDKDEVFLARLGAEALFNNFQTDAYDLFNAALKVNKNNHTALKGLGIILGERGQYKRAVAKLRTYNRLVPDDAEARYQLGEIYRLMGREGNAVREFKRAARIIKKKGKKSPLVTSKL
ncbi:tetratricopeptide repeat protein [Maridesulfovibrio hydrothermalis]|nr:tetratricopeptide repeat protein [Maridesulfovibrio hydrothermalis]